VLKRVARLYSDREAEKWRYDPMLFLLVNRKTRRREVWPFYWGKDRSGT
jgi:hypothetical protein